MEIEKIEKVHSIGHRLEDAKVTVSKDFKFNVAGVKVEGKQGDVNNMPQWVGKILSDNELASLDSQDMIAELSQALLKEQSVGDYNIATLEPHFYIKLKESMKELNHDDFNKVEGTMLELFRMRRGKLVKIADTIKLNSELYSKLTVEENIFYKTIHENSVEFEKQIRGDPNEQSSN